MAGGMIWPVYLFLLKIYIMIENYTEDTIKSLDWKDHIRLRPGMYIGKLGDGTSPDDGIYVLLKEILDNSIDEYIMGFGKQIDIVLKDGELSVRDYGRGIPLGKLVACVSKINTGAKYDSKVFKKTVGLNGVGTKAVNALSDRFIAQSYREGESKFVQFERGEQVEDKDLKVEGAKNGTLMSFMPDAEVFKNYRYRVEYIDKMLWHYAFLNKGLVLNFNGNRIVSKNGLLDLLDQSIDSEPIYPIIHLGDEDFEFALTHSHKKYGEEYYSFVNGQNTTQGGTHLSSFKEAIVKTIRDHYSKNYDAQDIRASVTAAISIKISEPVFESQTKTKLGSQHMEPEGRTIRKYVLDVVNKQLDDYLHKNTAVAEVLQRKIVAAEKERKEIDGIKKLARKSAKKASLHNKKLRDCKIHYNTNHDDRLNTTIFITEGDSASGSITKSRNVKTQAVFSLKGKPLNSYGMSKKIVYQNEEFNLLQAALNLEEGIDNLRYNNIVVATDADVDGMHIRLLLLTFFLQFYPEVVKTGHVYILQTPLFRVRNKKETRYCYSEQERIAAMGALGKNPEITRFKGLGEISPHEFKNFIGESIRLEPVILNKESKLDQVLSFYMGKNTPTRQEFIIDNLRFEEDVVAS